MKTIGVLLKEARTKKRYSRARLEKGTKIKKEFIEALEKEKWEELPELPVVQGFVKNIAQFLKIDDKRAAALLRRDYPPKTLSINPKPDVSEKFTWSPKLTFIAGAIVISLAILGLNIQNLLALPN
jgi:cytoskeletal protein RodZ